MVNELTLLKGKPITLQNLKIKPLTLNEIEEIGEHEYNLLISMLLLKKSDLKNNEGIDQEVLSSVNDYQLFLLLCTQDEFFWGKVKQSLNMLTGEDFFVDFNEGVFFYVENEVVSLTEELFNSLRQILMSLNFMAEKEEDKENPASDKAKELLEKRKKYRKKVAEQNKEKGLSLGDITSIVASYSNGYNLYNIWDLTVYQLYNEYIRLQLWDDYQNKQTLLPHVEDKKSLDIKHWATKVDPNIFKEEK